MQSPTRNSRVTADDCKALYCNIFSQELHAIISSRDYKSRYANLTREDRRKIKENHKEIADNAVRYFIDNNGADLVDEGAVNNLFEESILKALEIFR